MAGAHVSADAKFFGLTADGYNLVLKPDKVTYTRNLPVRTRENMSACLAVGMTGFWSEHTEKGMIWATDDYGYHSVYVDRKRGTAKHCCDKVNFGGVYCSRSGPTIDFTVMERAELVLPIKTPVEETVIVTPPAPTTHRVAAAVSLINHDPGWFDDIPTDTLAQCLGLTEYDSMIEAELAARKKGTS